MGKLTQKIDKAIEAKGITKTAFADKIAVSRDTVYNWTDENIKVSTLLKISDTLGVPIAYFLEEPQNEVSEPQAGYAKKGVKSVFVSLNSNDTVKIDLKNKQLEIIKK
jgi:transcriptional regulator with XRE-family HTH domain